MLRQYIGLLTQNASKIIIRDNSTATVQKWDLLTAVCIERKPLLTPPLNELQTKFKKYLAAVELEGSHKSDHEIRHELDLKQAELLKKGETDPDLALKQMAQDFVDASVEELKKFKPAHRDTDADKKKDSKSLNRKLDRHLVLLTKQKIGEKNHYLFPQGKREDGETLRQTADRLIKETFGDDLKVSIYGNSPCGFYKYRYPTKVRPKETGSVGAKVFFYFGRYVGGSVPKGVSDHKWVDRTELRKELHPDYRNSVEQFLIDENQ